MSEIKPVACATCGEEPYYTADALRQARLEALEEAAGVCDWIWKHRHGLESGTASQCSDAIRALKEKRDE